MSDLSLCEQCKYYEAERTRFTIEVLADADVTVDPFVICLKHDRPEFMRWNSCCYLEDEVLV